MPFLCYPNKILTYKAKVNIPPFPDESIPKAKKDSSQPLTR